MAMVVYLLCALTSLACAMLLLRGFTRTRQKLLFWSGLAFVGMFLNNAILVVDVRLGPTVDLSTWRSLPALAGVMILIYGVVMESRA